MTTEFRQSIREVCGEPLATYFCDLYFDYLYLDDNEAFNKLLAEFPFLKLWKP